MYSRRRVQPSLFAAIETFRQEGRRYSRRNVASGEEQGEMAVFAGYLACSQTLYFLFKVRRERVIKFIDRQRKGVVARARFARRCFRKKRKEKLKKLLCTGYRLLFFENVEFQKISVPFLRSLRNATEIRQCINISNRFFLSLSQKQSTFA